MLGNSTGPIFWLKEMSKSWVYVVSDKVVHQEQVTQQEPAGVVNSLGGLTYVEGYLASNLWLEILLKVRRSQHSEFYVALIESCEAVHEEPLRVLQPSGDVNLRESRQDEAMFVDVVNTGENPQRMSSSLSLRSVVRLHRADVSPDIFAKAFESGSEASIFRYVDWEAGNVVSLDSQRPRDVIKGRTEPMHNLADKNTPRMGERLAQIGIEDISSILWVSFDTTSVRLTCDEGPDFIVEDIEVFLRPLDTSEGASHLLHDLFLSHDPPPASQSGTGSNAP